jgi:hypothetical protein
MEPSTPKRVRDWVRVNEACEMFSISKPVLYGWMGKGWIRNSSIKSRNQIRGVRLVQLSSIQDLIESRATGGILPDVTE